MLHPNICAFPIQYMYHADCHNVHSITFPPVDNHSDCLPKELVESISPSEAAVEFTELLLNFLMKTLLPYEGIPLEDGIEQLSDATWYTISECILLISWIIAESDDHTKKEIICCAAALPGCCRSMQLAFYIGTIVKSEGNYGRPMSLRLSQTRLSNNWMQ